MFTHVKPATDLANSIVEAHIRQNVRLKQPFRWTVEIKDGEIDLRDKEGAVALWWNN